MTKRSEQAKELVNSKKTIIFRMVLKNGNIAERVLSPITHTNDATEILYSDIINRYRPKDMIDNVDITNIDYSKLDKITKDIMPSTSTEQGIVLCRIETLLESGYQVCDLQ